jgi:hypothetical protein
MGIEFLKDNDAIEAVDQWGTHCWIVGNTVEGNINWVWAIDDGGRIFGVHPESIKAKK